MASEAELIELMCNENAAFFAATKLRGPKEPPFNGQYATGDHHLVWAEDINKHSRVCELAARGLGKSFFFSFAVPLWTAWKYPGRSGFIFSGSQPQAEEILIRIMREVEENPRLRRLLPMNRTKNRWSTRTLEFANGFVLHARGYGTKVRGGHPVLAVCDDILNDPDMYSEEIRKKNIDYFFSAIRNMVDPDGKIIVVGTPFHRQDLLFTLKNTPGYCWRVTPGMRNGQSVWPERYSTKYFNDLLAEIKSLRFSREILCEPASDLTSLFPSELFKGQAEVLGVPLGAPKQDWRWWRARGIKAVFMGVDFSVSTEIGHDYMVIFVLGVDGRGNHWVMDIFREQALSYGAQKSAINDMARRYRPDLIYVESVQAQKIFGDELIRETDLPIRHFVTSKKKHSFEDGLPSLRIIMENGKLRIPRGSSRAVDITDTWIHEMSSFTISNGKCLTVAKHDDTAMAYYIAEQAAADASFDYSFGESAEDEAAALEDERLMEAEAAAEEADMLMDMDTDMDEPADADELEHVFGVPNMNAEMTMNANANANANMTANANMDMDMDMEARARADAPTASGSKGPLPLTGTGIRAFELVLRRW